MTVVLANGALRYQWASEIAKFTGGTQDSTGKWHGGSSCVVVDGTPERRKKMYRKIRDERPAYVVFGYNQVVDDYDWVRHLDMDAIVADEITLAKNPTSDRSKALKTIMPEFRFGLTGDPIESRAEELFSIMQWVDPTVLGDPEVFDRTYVRRAQMGYVVGYQNLDVLHRVMNRSGAWYVRDDTDPELVRHLPESLKPERIAVPLDVQTGEVYDHIAAGLLDDLSRASQKSKGMSVAALYSGARNADSSLGPAAAKLTALRMLCGHPEALRVSGQKWLDTPDRKTQRTVRTFDASGNPIRVRRLMNALKPGSAYAAELVRSGMLDGLDRSLKMDATVDLIDRLLSENFESNIVVFSFFKQVLTILSEYFPEESVIYSGDLTPKKQDEAKRRFRSEAKVRLFLSSDAGGYGVDLPNADHLINVDDPFSAGARKQRNTRIRRFSSEWATIQTHNVYTTDTVEEFYAERTDRKEALGRAVKTGAHATRDLDMSVSSLSTFLAQHLP